MLLSNVLAPVLLAFSAIASPVESPENSLASRSIIPKVPKTLAQHAANAIKEFCPDATKTMMHSGIGPVFAARLAKKKKLHTVEVTVTDAVRADKKKANVYKETLSKYNVSKKEYVTKGGREEDWKEAWGQISEAWAKYAQSQTTLATHRGGPAVNSFYKTREEPILKQKHVKIIVDNEQTPNVPDY